MAQPQDENGCGAASKKGRAIFSLSLMPVAVGKAKVDGWAVGACRAMPLGVERRLV